MARLSRFWHVGGALRQSKCGLLALIYGKKWRKKGGGGRWWVGRAQGTTVVPFSPAMRGGGRGRWLFWACAWGKKREWDAEVGVGFLGSSSKIWPLPFSSFSFSLFVRLLQSLGSNPNFVNAQSSFGLKRSKTGVLTKVEKWLNKSNNDFEGMSSHQLKNFLNNRR